MLINKNEILFGNSNDNFLNGFNMGIEVAYTMDRNLTAVDVEDAYDIHKTTVQSWINSSLLDYRRRDKKIMSEFLKRYNPKNTKDYMKKYNLSPNNTKEFISESFLMDMDTIDKYQLSKIKWKQNLLRHLLGVNQELFGKQIYFLKSCLASEYELLTDGECEIGTEYE